MPAKKGEKRLGERLVELRLLDEPALQRALVRRKQSGRHLGETLVELGLINEDRLLPVLADQLGTSSIDLGREPPDAAAVQLVPEDFVRSHFALPVKRENGHVKVAMADPADFKVISQLQDLIGAPVIPVLASRTDIANALGWNPNLRGRVEEAARGYQEARPEIKTDQGLVHVARVGAESPAVEIVNLLIIQALHDRASDIHIEPQRDHLRVRFRVDGVLLEASTLPLSVHSAVLSRIKIMADMDIVERRRAQDGQINAMVEGRELDIRVSTMDTIYGEIVVLRLLDKSRPLITLRQLGFSPDAQRRFEMLLHSPYGMIICSGPTGSGKTTTLYASISELDRSQKNLMTLEDPVEYTFPNINQTQINRLADVTFANGLRAMLRQDPDIIMVGEIRDRDTAEISVHAAMTGHLVLSSLHASDSVSGLLRFLDMGIESFLITSALIGVIAQRLVRRICEHCKVAYEPSEEDREFARLLSQAPPPQLFRGQGCAHCNQTGYYDRVGVYEVLTIDEDVKRLTVRGASREALLKAALANGMVPLKVDAWHKAIAGVTTVAEIFRSVYLI